MKRLDSRPPGGYNYTQPTEPVDPEEGETWYDTDDNLAFVYTGNQFIGLSITQHNDLSGVTEGQHRSNSRVESLSGNVVEDHRTSETHATAQPPQNHGNAAHDATFETEAGAQSRADDAEASAENYADGEIENHRTSETHTTAQPPQDHALGGDIHDTATRAELNALVSDATLESESGAQAKANAAESSAETFADNQIESHRQNETHATAQPPQSHNNAAHTESYTTSAEAAAAAPVDSVNGQTGAVSVASGAGFGQDNGAGTLFASNDGDSIIMGGVSVSDGYALALFGDLNVTEAGGTIDECELFARYNYNDGTTTDRRVTIVTGSGSATDTLQPVGIDPGKSVDQIQAGLRAVDTSGSGFTAEGSYDLTFIGE